ncbi:MAG: hypothetical protein AAFU70_03285, partial [Planctomycetota bacterium]
AEAFGADQALDVVDDLLGQVLGHVGLDEAGGDDVDGDALAAAVSYVTSDDAGFLTGQVIAVDGGMTMC